MMSSECPHGHQALDGYLLPVNLLAGATFDPAMVRAAYRVSGRQLQNMGVDFALMSMLDVLRDPRWGRSEECYSEDPYLSARMAEAAVIGMQESGPEVVAKHFAAQGEGTGGVNASAARIGERGKFIFLRQRLQSRQEPRASWLPIMRSTAFTVTQIAGC